MVSLSHCRGGSVRVSLNCRVSMASMLPGGVRRRGKLLRGVIFACICLPAASDRRSSPYTSTTSACPYVSLPSHLCRRWTRPVVSASASTLEHDDTRHNMVPQEPLLCRQLLCFVVDNLFSAALTAPNDMASFHVSTRHDGQCITR